MKQDKKDKFERAISIVEYESLVDAKREAKEHALKNSFKNRFAETDIERIERIEQALATIKAERDELKKKYDMCEKARQDATLLYVREGECKRKIIKGIQPIKNTVNNYGREITRLESSEKKLQAEIKELREGKGECEWEHMYHKYGSEYKTSCGEELDAGEHPGNYCKYCGKKIKKI